ncbi:hypothetical protein [uncultured Tenacibaculum sp.]|uniref:hypothetical protein n=1 Tax=uncultured Tenacibaculum sp. TaxID=174713 RepID=UPI00261BF04E|nr:hypothetical protein [uncultured Tenacibaculum sp.]
MNLPIIVGFLFISLFIWRFSYWRNNGLGDSGRIPLSGTHEIKIIDWVQGTIYSNGSQLAIAEKIYCKDDILYIANNNGYSIIELRNDVIHKNLSAKEFTNMQGEVNKLQKLSKFHSSHHSTFKLLLF